MITPKQEYQYDNGSAAVLMSENQAPDAHTQFLGRFVSNIGQSVSDYLPGWKERDANPTEPMGAVGMIRDTSNGPNTGDTVDWSSNPVIDTYTVKPDDKNAGSLDAQLQPLALTDKQSSVYGSTPQLVRSDSVFTRLKQYVSNDALSIPIDATSLHNPAAAALDTYKVGDASPLANDYAGGLSFVSGSDNAQAVSELAGQDVSLTQSPTPPPTDSTGESSFIPGVPTALDFFSKKSVREETYLFVVGAIILAIGIFALTR